MSRLRIALTAVTAASWVTAAFAHDNHDHATGVVKERMETMSAMDKRLKGLVQRVRYKTFNTVADDARAINTLAAKIVTQFPPGSTQHPSAARPEIWKTWADFEAKAKALETASEKLMAMDIADKKAITAQVKALSHTCDSCHDRYEKE
jgi:cytochrome c556